MMAATRTRARGSARPRPRQRSSSREELLARRARAIGFYCVQDAADYFRLVRQALLGARQTVFILGWDILAARRSAAAAPSAVDDAPTRLDELLAFIARRRPQLRCYILIWDYAALYTLERDPLSRWRLGWRMPRHVRFGFDDRHPVGGSHHQKIVVVDDQLAFCGGIDLTGHRWDTSAHRVEEPARTNAARQAVRAVSRSPGDGDGPSRGEPRRAGARSLARARRGADAAGRRRPPTISGRPTSTPDLDRCRRRHRPDASRHPRRSRPSASARRCFWIRLPRAKRSIYIESQYFTNDTLGAALAARLREPDGPEVLVVTPTGMPRLARAEHDGRVSRRRVPPADRRRHAQAAAASSIRRRRARRTCRPSSTRR